MFSFVLFCKCLNRLPDLSFSPTSFHYSSLFPSLPVSIAQAAVCQLQLVPRRESRHHPDGFLPSRVSLQWQDHLISYSMCLSKDYPKSQIHLVEFFHAHSVDPEDSLLNI